MSISGGINWVVIQKALQNWVVYCTGLAADHVVWGQQYAPRSTQPAISMKLSLLQDDGMPWLDPEPNPLVIATMTITAVDAAANTLTKVAHGLLTGDGPVRLDSTTNDLPLNLVEGVDYWVVKITADTFKLATSFLNAMAAVPVVVDLGDAGSGVITLFDTDETLRAGAEIVFKSRSLIKAVLTLQCYTSVGVGLDMATSVLWRIQAKRRLPTAAAILENANIGVIEMDRIRAIEGTQDLVLFEPRAFTDIVLHLTSEDSETGTIIERTDITNQSFPDTFTVDGAE